MKVIPNAKAFSVSLGEGVLKVRVRSPAEGGRANGELEKTLSKKLGKKVSITKGFKSREKEIQVEGMDEEEVVQKVYSLSN
ncbi:MAG: DUF167 domain-containing protein [Candidatus Micrarchaeota archaeon]